MPIPDNRNWDMYYSTETFKPKKSYPLLTKKCWIDMTLDEVYADIEKTYQKIKKAEIADEKIGI